MKPKTKFCLFIHGGPGLNSFPEIRQLSPLLEDTPIHFEFWHEPSRLRPEGCPYRDDRAFENWVDSALDRLKVLAESHGPITLVGHSFGSRCVYELALLHPEWIRKLVLVSPSLDNYECQKNILRIAARDFEKNSPGKSGELKSLLASSTHSFDESIQKGVSLAIQDPDLFSNYWSDREKMREWLSALSTPGYTIDMDSFFSVLRTMPELEVKGSTCALPVDLVFGDMDPVVSRSREVDLARRLFASWNEVTFAGCGHSPHMELPMDFFNLILFGEGRETPDARPVA